MPGQTSHPELLKAADQIVRVARKHNKKVITACGAAEFHHWLRLGVDLLFCTNNIVCLKTGAQLALDAAEAAIATMQNESKPRPALAK
jgi:2-keto-3-deoxy-L-rhamnonate aldolase RhmA